MKRGTFLKRVGLVIGGVAVGRHIPLETPLTEAVAETAASRLGNTGVSFYAEGLRASGGLCAPLMPYYDMPSFAARPVSDALPLFTASRGGITSPE